MSNELHRDWYTREGSWFKAAEPLPAPTPSGADARGEAVQEIIDLFRDPSSDEADLAEAMAAFESAVRAESAAALQEARDEAMNELRLRLEWTSSAAKAFAR